MRPRTAGLLALVLGATIAVSASARSQTYFGFQIGVGNAPPPVAYFGPPHMLYEPEYRVYVVDNGYDDYDTFRYGPYWYSCDGDYWYRASSYRGPYFAIDVR